MVKTTTTYICDICGCEIKESDLPFDFDGFLSGKQITIRDGIIGRPIKTDMCSSCMCSSCFENMKKFCKSKKEGAK